MNRNAKVIPRMIPIKCTTEGSIIINVFDGIFPAVLVITAEGETAG
jgi:hypothetical protein